MRGLFSKIWVSIFLSLFPTSGNKKKKMTTLKSIKQLIETIQTLSNSLPKSCEYKKPQPRPGQAGARPRLLTLAQLVIFKSRSPQKPSQSPGFQAKPGRNSTTCNTITRIDNKD
jgi:hypothetical protein